MKSIQSKLVGALLGLSSTLSMGPALAETAALGDYHIDPAHSSVHFEIGHLGTSRLVGRFNSVEGELSLAPEGQSRVEVRIATASVDTNHEKRDDHLRSPDFFNAKQYPEMRFSADGVQLGNGVPQRIKGELSLHGRTRPVTLTVEAVGAGADPWGGYRAGYHASTVIQRSDFGMDFMADGIGDEVIVRLDIEAIKQ